MCVSGVEKVNTGRRGTQQLRETGIMYGNASFMWVIDEAEGASMWTKGEKEENGRGGVPTGALSKDVEVETKGFCGQEATPGDDLRPWHPVAQWTAVAAPLAG